MTIHQNPVAPALVSKADLSAAIHPLEQHAQDMAAHQRQLDAASERGRIAADRVRDEGRAAGRPATEVEMDAICMEIWVTFGGAPENYVRAS